MTEKDLLAYLCNGADKRISRTTKYQQLRDLRSDRVYYTIPPDEYPNIYDDLGPVVKPEHMPKQGVAEYCAFVSGEYRILIAYAPEIDTVFWGITQ